MGFLSNMMTPPAPGSRGAQFGAAMGDMAPLLFSMAQGLRSGKGAAAYAPQGLAAMMYQQQLEEEQKMSEEERAYRRGQDARTWGWRESERAREDQLRNAAQAGLAEALGGFNTTGVTDPARQAFDSLQTAWGTPLKVNSAYRSPEHNARVGGAKNSQHTHGNAFDVDVSGMSREERLRLIQEARRNGFRGIGVYDNALHFDVGPARAWGADYSSKSLPEWAMGAATGPINGIPAGQPSQSTGQPRLSPERAAAILSNPYASEAARNLVLSQFMPQEQEKPQIVKGADGYNYWVTPDGRSMRAVPGAKAPDTGWRTLTPDQAEALGYDPAKGPYQIGLSGENRGKVTTGSGQTIYVGDQNPLSPGQKKVDEEFAPKYLEWITTGGADSNVNAAQIASVLGKLESGEQLTGPEVGYVPELFRALTNPDAEQARAQVEQVVQRNLREILGGQFAQMEGAQLIKRAYDQKLKPEFNAARLRALYGVLDHAAKAKASMIDYWNANNGTLAGYQGPRIPSVEDFYAAIEGATAQQGSAAMPTVTGMAARIDKFVESALNNEERRIFEELPAADQMTFLRRKGFK